jgi:ATP-dependent helicase/nuclease subunit A
VKKWGDALIRQQNLNTIIDVAKRYDDECLQNGRGTSIAGFINYLNSNEDKPEPDNVSNTIKVMTYHKSKGLEWPIVFLTGISGSKAGKTDTSIGKFNKIGGAFFKRYTGEQVVPFYNSYNNLIEKHEEASEAIRIFYVALTRARETLYMVCEKDKYDGVTVPIINNRLFLNLLKVSKYDIEYEEGNVEPNFLEGHNLVIDIDDENKEIVEFCSVFEEKVSRIASHKVDENEITEQLQARLDFGIELHEHMETIDFRNPDTSHIKSPRTKQFIDKILQLDVFKECQSDKFIDAYKEYEFIDDNLHGFVDLFLLFEDRIEIIDYKLKNIDKPEYKEQLKTYKDYLEKIFKKRCRTYLISLVDCKIKEITHD